MACLFASAISWRPVSADVDTPAGWVFGRLLRFVYADGILVNAKSEIDELGGEGYARAGVYSPDAGHAECFAALEREAKMGLWRRR